MREKLAKKFKLNQREKYKAKFKRFGIRNGYKREIKTVLLTDIVDQYHKLVASHLWMDCGKQFDKLNLKEGDMIQFYARPKIYEKGYLGYDEFGEKGFPIIDYGLKYPSKVAKLTQEYVIKRSEIIDDKN